MANERIVYKFELDNSDFNKVINNSLNTIKKFNEESKKADFKVDDKNIKNVVSEFEKLSSVLKGIDSTKSKELNKEVVSLISNLKNTNNIDLKSVNTNIDKITKSFDSLNKEIENLSSVKVNFKDFDVDIKINKIDTTKLTNLQDVEVNVKAKIDIDDDELKEVEDDLNSLDRKAKGLGFGGFLKDLNLIKEKIKSIGKEGFDKFKTGDITGGIKTFKEGLSGLGETLQTTSPRLGSFISSLGAIGTGGVIAAGVVAAIAAIGVGVFKLAGYFRDAAGEVSAFTKEYVKFTDVSNIENINQVVASAKTLSDNFGIGAKELAKFTKNIAAGFSTANATIDQTQKILEGFIKAGATEEDLDWIAEYSTQMDSLGFTLQDTIELQNQFNKAGIFSDKGLDSLKEAGLKLREFGQPLQDSLTASFGADFTADVKKRIDAGIPLEEIIKDISKRSKILGVRLKGDLATNLFGAAGEDAGNALFEVLSKEFKTVDDQLKGELLKISQNAKGNFLNLAELTGVDDKALDKLKKNVKDQTTTFDGAVRAILKNTKDLAEPERLNLLRQLFGDLPEDQLRKLEEAYLNTASITEDQANNISKNALLTDDLLQAQTEYNETLLDTSKIYEGIDTRSETIFTQLKNSIASFLNEDIQPAIASIYNFFLTVIENAQPIFDVFTSIFREIYDVFAQVFKLVGDLFGAAFGDIFKVGNETTTLAEKIKTFFNIFAGVVNAIFTPFKILTTVINGIIQAIRFAINIVRDFRLFIVNSTLDLIKPFENSIKDFTNGIANFIDNIINFVIESINNLFGIDIGKIFRDLKADIIDLYNTIVGFIKTTNKDIKVTAEVKKTLEKTTGTKKPGTKLPTDTGKGATGTAIQNINVNVVADLKPFSDSLKKVFEEERLLKESAIVRIISYKQNKEDLENVKLQEAIELRNLTDTRLLNERELNKKITDIRLEESERRANAEKDLLLKRNEEFNKAIQTLAINPADLSAKVAKTDELIKQSSNIDEIRQLSEERNKIITNELSRNSKSIVIFNKFLKDVNNQTASELVNINTKANEDRLANDKLIAKLRENLEIETLEKIEIANLRNVKSIIERNKEIENSLLETSLSISESLTNSIGQKLPLIENINLFNKQKIEENLSKEITAIDNSINTLIEERQKATDDINRELITKQIDELGKRRLLLITDTNNKLLKADIDYINKLNEVKLEQVKFERELIDEKLNNIETYIDEYLKNTQKFEAITQNLFKNFQGVRQGFATQLEVNATFFTSLASSLSSAASKIPDFLKKNAERTREIEDNLTKGRNLIEQINRIDKDILNTINEIDATTDVSKKELLNKNLERLTANKASLSEEKNKLVGTRIEIEEEIKTIDDRIKVLNELLKGKNIENQQKYFSDQLFNLEEARGVIQSEYDKTIQVLNQKQQELEDQLAKDPNLANDEAFNAELEGIKKQKDLIKFKYDEEIKANQEGQDRLKKILKDSGSSEAIKEDAKKELKALKKRRKDRQKEADDENNENNEDIEEDRKRKISFYLGVAADISNALFTALQSAKQTQIDALSSVIEKQAERVNNVRAIIEEGGKRAKNVSTELLEAETNRQEELEKLRQQEIERQQDYMVAQLAIQASLAVAQAFVQYPFPANLAVAVATAASFFASIAAVRATAQSQRVKAREGMVIDDNGRMTQRGVLVGQTHTNGGVKIEAEAGERIFSRKHESRFSDIFDMIATDKIGRNDLILKKDMFNHSKINFNTPKLVQKEIDISGLSKDIQELKRVVEYKNYNLNLDGEKINKNIESKNKIKSSNNNSNSIKRYKK